jgi:hypothetical protein
MADQLVTPQELATFLQLTYASLTSGQQATLAMLAELATAKVQDAAGQLLVEGTATVTIDVGMCDNDQYQPLPQSPVRSVASVLIDGVADTAWRLSSQQLWRLAGWNTNPSAPTQLTVTFTYGFAAGAQALEPARGYVFALAAGVWGNPAAVQSEQLDDYRISYADADALMVVPDAMRESLRNAYGTTAHVLNSRH